jgi:hypothetical protein
MADTHFQLARFESCGIYLFYLYFILCYFILSSEIFLFTLGNGAFFTENAGTGAYGGLSYNEIYNVGFSWNPAYRYVITHTCNLSIFSFFVFFKLYCIPLFIYFILCYFIYFSLVELSQEIMIML